MKSDNIEPVVETKYLSLSDPKHSLGRKYDVIPGATINDACAEAVYLASIYTGNILFEYNGVSMCVRYPLSDVEGLLQYYWKHAGTGDKIEVEVVDTRKLCDRYKAQLARVAVQAQMREVAEMLRQLSSNLVDYSERDAANCVSRDGEHLFKELVEHANLWRELLQEFIAAKAEEEKI